MTGTTAPAVFEGALIDRYRQQAMAVRDPIPEEGPEGWFRSDFDAARLAAVYPALQLKPEYTVLTWIFRSGGNGNGLVLAFRRDDPALEASMSPVHALVSEDAIPAADRRNPMHAITGDGSPLSYLSASLLQREFWEVGALWHGVRWDVEEIICTKRSRLYGATRRALLRNHWQRRFGRMDWTGPQPDPDDLAPTVAITPKGSWVTMHTHGELGRERVTRWTDRYSGDSLVPRICSDQLATGHGGFVF